MTPITWPSTARRRLGEELAQVRRAAAAAARGPGRERDIAVQTLKAAGAAAAAWALTGLWLGAPLALLAPWTALSLVEATVYRPVRAGLQQLVLIVAGALAASAAMAVTGGSTLGALLLALPVTLLAGTHRGFGAQGLYGATTALLVITYGAYSPVAVGYRLLETLIGAAIGIGVNAGVLPPVHLRSVREQLVHLIRDSTALLRTWADTLGGGWDETDAAAWQDHARRLVRYSRAVSEARQWTTENARLNPGARLRRAGAPPVQEHDLRWEGVTGHLATITRTLSGMAGEQARLTPPGTAFLAGFAELAGKTAALCAHQADDLAAGRAPYAAHARPDRALAEVWGVHERLAADFGRQTGTMAAVSGELLVESEQLLARLTPRGDRPDG